MNETHILKIIYKGKINDGDYMYILDDESILCYLPWLPSNDLLARMHLTTEYSDLKDYQLNYFSEDYEIKMPKEYYSITDQGKLISSKEIDGYRIEKFHSDKSLFNGIVIGKWNKYVDTIQNFEISLLLKNKNLEKLNDIKSLSKELVKFYSNKFGVPEKTNFSIIDANVYWVSETYSSADMEAIDVSMALFWWKPKKRSDVSWFFRSLASYSSLLFWKDKYGNNNFENRIRYCWEDYYSELEYENYTNIKENWRLSKNLGYIIHYNLMKNMGEENYFKMCRELLSIYNNLEGYSEEDLLELIYNITGKDFKWFFKQWTLNKIKPVFNLEYKILQSGGSKIIKGVISQNKDIFKGIVDVGLITENDTIIKEVFVNDSIFKFELDCSEQITNVVLDPKKILLLEGTEEIKRKLKYVKNINSLYYKKSWVKLIKQIDKILEVSYNFQTRWLYKKGTYLMKNKQYTEANKTFLLALNSFNPTLESKNLLPKIYLSIGNTFDLHKNRDKALEYYNRVLNDYYSHPHLKTSATKFIKQKYKP